MFIYPEPIVGPMDPREFGERFWGIPVLLIGICMILLSGQLLPSVDPLGSGGELKDLLMKGGFAVALLGLFSLFLFSGRTIPAEISFSFLDVQGTNLGRLTVGMNLKGKGIYFPPAGRLKQDRVYIPLERHDLPLPAISDETVLNVGSTTPSMGLSLIPPGMKFVDTVEEMTGRRFQDDDPKDGTESLERLSRGTGMFRKIEMKNDRTNVSLRIEHDRGEHVCNEIRKEYPTLHGQVGCPLCSSVLCATARICRVPLRIGTFRKEGNEIIYDLEKVTR